MKILSDEWIMIAWRDSFGFKALMKSISCTKLLNLFLNFLSTSKQWS